jgi:hypothetical protein
MQFFQWYTPVDGTLRNELAAKAKELADWALEGREPLLGPFSIRI